MAKYLVTLRPYYGPPAAGKGKKQAESHRTEHTIKADRVDESQLYMRFSKLREDQGATTTEAIAWFSHAEIVCVRKIP